MLESLGIARPGEGVAFFADGRSAPGGSLPINTNGGGLSYTHTGSKLSPPREVRSLQKLTKK